MNFKNYYGTHLSKANGILNTLNYCKSLNLNNCQIFTKSPQKFMKIKDSSIIDIELIESFIEKYNFNLYIHSQYIINLCRTDLKYATHSVIEDLNYIKNSKGVVIHMGKDTQNLGETQAFDNMKNNILAILSNMKYDNYLILETSVRTKSDVCKFYSIESLAKLFNELNKPKNIKFCIDTCHIFSSDYDVSTITGFNDFIKKFDNLIGIQHITLFHLNDSKTILGSNVDRHADLTTGHIFKNNVNTLKYIINWCIKHKISFITETHKELEKELIFLENILL